MAYFEVGDLKVGLFAVLVAVLILLVSSSHLSLLDLSASRTRGSAWSDATATAVH